MTTPAPFAVHAIRYATSARRRAENFVGGDPHDGPMPLDYFVWAATGDAGTFVIDTGFSKASAARRGRVLLRAPAEGLRAIGIDPAIVTDVILTHFHYDHAGCLDEFPVACLHVQDEEMHYATGRLMRHALLRRGYDADDIVSVLRRLYAGRVVFHDGDEEIVPGLSVHLVGGHTHGLQVVRIWTRCGWVVLASDACHFYANIEAARPFPSVASIADMLDGFERVQALASAPDLVVPGHDPEIMQRFAPSGPGLENIAVRIDAEPRVTGAAP